MNIDRIRQSIRDRRSNYRLQDEFDKAIDDLNSRRNRIRGYHAYIERGQAYVHRHDYEESIADYTEAIRINPQLDDAYNVRGLAYDILGMHNDAIADYTKAMELNVQDTFATLVYYNNRGASYRERGLYDEAIRDLDRAVSVEHNAMPYLNRGLTYEKKR